MRPRLVRPTIIPWLLLLLLTACRPQTAAAPEPIPVGVLWDVPRSENGTLNWAMAAPIAQEQHAGFMLANQGGSLDALIYPEGNRNDDVQTAIRALAEGDAAEPVTAIIGATSNEATARAVSLANFFNLPMLVPGASGDNLLPEGNLWAFQLSASNADYANYLLNTLLNQQTLNAGLEEAAGEPAVRIAILYEQNTYGETAAVSAAKAALAQQYEVVLYDKFPAQQVSAAHLRTLVNRALDENAQLVLMISSDPATAGALTRTFLDLSSADTRPLLIGMSSGFLSQTFMDSPQAEHIYVVRQKIDTASCPEAITSLHEAQAYAAASLLARLADGLILPPDVPGSDRQAAYREALRDALKSASLEVPCLGKVAFDNDGKNKLLRFEIVTARDNQVQIIPEKDFINLVKQFLLRTGYP